jgi:hypothetical protein
VRACRNGNGSTPPERFRRRDAVTVSGIMRGMVNGGLRINRVDRFWMAACAAAVLVAFVLLGVRTVIERHQFAKAHSLAVDHNEMIGELVVANGVGSCVIVLYVFAIPSRLVLNLCLRSRWYAYHWETLWLIIAFGVLSSVVYISALYPAEG